MIVVTAATGHLGRLVIEGLLETTPAEQIVAAVRDPAKAADLAARGVYVRQADYDQPETLKRAFTTGDRVLYISSNSLSREAEHAAVVDAATEAGVALIAYTSLLHADVSGLPIAPDHRAAEERIRATGIPFTFLRNGWYTENFESSALQGAEHGTIFGSSGEGRVASATRDDYAAAAVAALTGEGHENKIYELSGDSAWSMPELAAEVSATSGKPVTYKNLPLEEYEQVLISVGLPEPVAAMYARFEPEIAKGALASTPGDLRKLIGRPTTPLRDSVTAFFARA